MKFAFAFILAITASQAAIAIEVPELYCVSTKSYHNVNQINVFTNKKGTMNISLQFYAVSEYGDEAGFFDTDMLQTITKLNYDSATGIISNGARKASLQVSKTPITPAAAAKLLVKGEFDDLENPSGHKVLFKQYYTAKMIEYTLPGRKGYWDRSLMEAFNAGVTDYVCGNIKDAKGPRPSIFDALGNDGD